MSINMHGVSGISIIKKHDYSNSQSQIHDYYLQVSQIQSDNHNHHNNSLNNNNGTNNIHNNSNNSNINNNIITNRNG